MNSDPHDHARAAHGAPDEAAPPVGGAALPTPRATPFGAIGNAMPAGTRVEDFDIAALLGESGSAIVYQASDRRRNAVVALREYLPQALAERTPQGRVQARSDWQRADFELGLQAFIQQARLLATFDHPALLKVYRWAEANGTAYMALPLVDGRTLQDVLGEMDAPPDEAWLRTLLEPLTGALQVLHDGQCWHRNIGPEAVLLLSGSQRPLLRDFGAARCSGDDPALALPMLLNTGYAPLEQYGQGDDLTQGPWTDLYALAALVHWAILGQPPPSAPGRARKDSWLPLAQAAAGRYSMQFLSAFDHALALRPQDRTQSVLQLRLELGMGPAAPGAGPVLAQPGAAPAGAQPGGAAPASPGHHLPLQGTRFLGREDELRQVKAGLSGARLVTLLGMGGVGKTRLALQAGAELVPAFADGVWLLDLAPIRNAAFVVGHAAQIFGVREEPGRALLQSLVAQLKARRLLLVIDNCEHLVDAAAALANALLRGSTQLRILASSREALRVPGEQVCPVLPFPLPPIGADLPSLLQCSAVRLFVERAQEHKHGFTLTERDVGAVTELVARLEGIPLALELAAARISSMGVAEINKRMKDRYKILTGGSEVLHERQHTLRATVDWSYELLHDSEKTLFKRLGVFVGGLDMAAAEAVCGTEPLAVDEVLDLLGALVEKSLLTMDQHGGSTRYRMLETIRDYAREKLRDSGEFGAAAAAHGQYFLALAKQVRDGMKGRDQGVWIGRAEAEIDNLRAAMALAQTGGIDPVILVKMAVALQGFWVLRGRATEGRAIVRAALELPEVRASAVAHAHALYVGAALALTQSDHDDALALLTECLVLRRENGKPAEVAATLSTLTKVQLRAGDPGKAGWAQGGTQERRRWSRGQVDRARSSAAEALELLRAAGDQVGEAIALLDLGQIELFQGDFAAAAIPIEESLALARRLEHREVEAECERSLGEIALELDDEPLARSCLGRALAISSAAGDSRGEACAWLWLGKLALKAGAVQDARGLLARAVAVFQAHEMRAEWIDGLSAIAAVALQGNEPAQARQLLRAVAGFVQRSPMVRSKRAVLRCDALEGAVLARLPAPPDAPGDPSAVDWDVATATGFALRVCA